MRASPIDPLDQASEIDDPAYRVYFWTGSAGSLWSCSEWELAEADIDEVLDWVKAHANGRLHSLWLALRRPDGVQLVRLRGIDPTAEPSTWPGWAREARV